MMPADEPRGETMTSLLESVALERPESPALRYGQELLSWRAFLDRTRRVAGGLAAAGLQAGDRLAVWLPTVPDYLALCFAAWRLGATVVSVNTRFNAAELEHVLRGLRPRMLAFWPGFADIDFPGILAAVPAELRADLRAVLLYQEDGGAAALPAGLVTCPVRTVAQLAQASPLRDDRASPDAECVTFTTSGTTRAPKFVLHRHRGVAHHARDVASALGFDAADAVTLQTLPLCAVFGFAQAIAAIAGGSPQIMLPRFDGGRAAALVREHRVTHCMGTDELFQRMLAACPEVHAFPTLRVCGYVIFGAAAGPFREETVRRRLPLVGLFGMSEVLALFAVQRAADPPELRMRDGGFPVSPLAAVRARDLQNEEILPHGEVGMLEVRGPSVMTGYIDNHEATQAAFTEDGFLRTGDLGSTCADGSFLYFSRLGDVLRLGGFLVNPLEIEAHLERHPDLVGAQVVGARGPRGDCAVAFVLMRDGATYDEASLRAFCTGALAKYKMPDRFVPLHAFPVTRSGNGTKIQRHKLRELAQALYDTAGCGG